MLKKKIRSEKYRLVFELKKNRFEKYISVFVKSNL